MEAGSNVKSTLLSLMSSQQEYLAAFCRHTTVLPDTALLPAHAARLQMHCVAGRILLVCVCVCVCVCAVCVCSVCVPGVCMFCCVFFPFILNIKFVGRTSRRHTGGRSHRILIHLLSAVRALIFLARRVQPFLSLVDREVEVSVLTI